VNLHFPNLLSRRHSVKKTCRSDSRACSDDLQNECHATKCGEAMPSQPNLHRSSARSDGPRRNSAPNAHSAQSRSASSQRRRGSAPAVLVTPVMKTKAQWNSDEPDLVALLAKLQTVEDLYRVLQVDDDAADEGVVRAYKKLALKFHPDKNPDQSATAETIFKIILKAYDILHDSSKRGAYDRARAEANKNIIEVIVSTFEGAALLKHSMNLKQTVAELTSVIEERVGMAPSEQRLFFHDAALLNKTLSLGRCGFTKTCSDVILRRAEVGEDVAARCGDEEDFQFRRPSETVERWRTVF